MNRLPFTALLAAAGLLLTAEVWAAPPQVGTLAPSAGSSAPDEWVTFTATYSDADGWTDLKEVQFLTSLSASQANAVCVRYVRSTNKLYLLNDAGSAWLGGVAPGSAKILQNSRGQLDCAQTTVTGAGTVLTVKWQISFKLAAAQKVYKTYLWAKDNSVSTGWIQQGTWGVSRRPVIGTLAPPDGSTYTEGDAVAVSASATDPDGDPLEYQFLIDGVVKRPWGAASRWTWNTAGAIRQRRLTVQVRDPYQVQAEKSAEQFGYRRARGTP